MGILLADLNSIGFLSWQFYFMLLIYIPLFWMLPAKSRKFLLISASIAFYLMNGMRTLILLFYLILSGWVMSLVIDKNRQSRCVLWAGIAVVFIPFLSGRVLNQGGTNLIFIRAGIYNPDGGRISGRCT